MVNEVDVEQTGWRLRGMPLLYRVVLLLTIGFVGSTGVVRWYEGAVGTNPMDVVLWLVTLLMCVIVPPVLLTALRSRVRLLPGGVEVRELRTRVYPWAEISGTRIESYAGNRSIKLTFRDGTTRSLPAPITGLRNSSNTTVPDAVEAIRRRLNAYRLDNHPGVETGSPMDDFFHEA